MAARRTNPWVAFAAGAVAMLALVLVWWFFQAADDAGDALRGAGEATEVVPDISPPRLPAAPPIPDAPTPAPR